MPFMIYESKGKGMKVKKSILNKESGITLITLVITVVIMILLTFTITINIDQYKSVNVKYKLHDDITALDEAVSQYYARNKFLPILNKYNNVSMIDKKNPNDNANYYVLDLDELKIDNLYYGQDYNAVKSINDSTITIGAGTGLRNLYIINEGSHTIYYPKGAEFDGKLHYSAEKVYSNVKDKQN